MNKERVWQDFIALPPDAQRLVIDFIVFLRIRYTAQSSPEISARPDLVEEPFIGLWRDRQDMQDSTAWVRGAREREWNVLQ